MFAQLVQSDLYWIGGIQGMPLHHCVVNRIPKMMRMPNQNDGMAMPAMLKERTT